MIELLSSSMVAIPIAALTILVGIAFYSIFISED